MLYTNIFAIFKKIYMWRIISKHVHLSNNRSQRIFIFPGWNLINKLCNKMIIAISLFCDYSNINITVITWRNH